MRWPIQQFTDVVRNLRQLAVVWGTCLLAVAPLGAAGPGSAPRPQPVIVTDADDTDHDETEDSVVVLHRKSDGEGLTPAPLSDGTEPLEPISQLSEFQPELADPEPSSKTAPIEPIYADDIPAKDELAEDDAAEFGAALRETAPVKVARLPSDMAKTYREPTPVEPTRFHGVQPGVSTKEQLIAEWGEPEDTLGRQATETLVFDVAPFADVQVRIEKDVVRSIRVELAAQEEHRELARKLRLDDLEAVTVCDEQSGMPIGITYPERGVVLLLAPSQEEVAPRFISHLILQELKADAFALRAENHLHGPYEKNLSDLARALVLEPQNAHAHWLQADIYLSTGQMAAAESAAAKAIETDSENYAYHLRWTCALENLGRYEQAVLETRKVLDQENAPEILRAQALHQMGRLASQGDAKTADKAIGFHTMAIELADTLAASDDPRQRRAALDLLLDAHLTVAREVARRDYQNKVETVSQWLSRASGLAEEMIANEGGTLELRLRVAEQALAALASMKPTKDPAPWIEEAQETADALLRESDDTMWRSRIHWQLGSAYYHAVRIQHTRQQPDGALAYGQSAMEHLADGAKLRDSQPAAGELVGLLYFHLGAVHAVYKQDHAKAVTWYEKAVPLLTGDNVTPELTVPRRQGEALVSMAVSYWQQGEKQQALELTEIGADLIEKAVTGGVIDQEVLAVPYGNLATMHKLLGNTSESAKYTVLAKNARTGVSAASHSVEQPRVEQPQVERPTANRRGLASPRTSRGGTQRMIQR